MASIFDAGEYFGFMENELEDDVEDEVEEEGEVEDEKEEAESIEESKSMDDIISTSPSQVQGSAYTLVAQRAMAVHSRVFLVDHMWTTTFPQHRRQLADIPGLAERISNIYICI